MSYAVVFAALYLLSAPVAFLGGQGFAPLVALAAIGALAFVRPPREATGWFVALALFLIWVGISMAWSPTGAGQGFIGGLSEGNFSLDAPAIRLIGSAVFGLLVILAALRVQNVGPVSKGLLRLAVGLHALGLLVVILFEAQLLAVFYPDGGDVTSATQNTIRNAMAFALALPLAFALVPRGWRVWGGLGLTAFGLFVSLRLGAEAGALSVLLASLGWAFASRLGSLVPASMLYGVGAIVLSAPLWAMAFTRVFGPRFDSLPPTMQTRLFSWEATLEKVLEQPLIGHGIGASRTWSATLGEDTERMARLGPIWENFRAVPGHPHSMPLHVWAETGVIGALLLSAAFVLLGRHVSKLSAEYAAPIAALVAGALVPALLSYSAWSELFWSQIALIIGAIIMIVHRPQPGTR